MTELAKTFEPGPIEARWYAHWEERGAFRPDRPDATPFTIVMPPPNVTGSLHIGHALDITLQDILIRHARMQGKDSLWVVGTDHAGIATQMVVERQLAERQDKRTNYSREDFITKVWEWKAESGGQITQQLRRLGASCDWANEQFTMDPGFSAAVTKVFVDLYNKGLLYRDKRLVNWDPGLKTAISDLEVETREVQGKFWHLRYPLAEGSGAIHVATTRPETMLADMAVAVNPSDERYTKMIGQMVKHPITGRLIPIVPDEHADPELGSGAVKITPGHDFNDFEVGKRAGIAPADMLNMFDAEARVVQTSDGLIPEQLLGLSGKDARAAVVELLEAAGTLESVEDRAIQIPFGDRSGAVIEPWLTDQWYVDAKTLAGPAIVAAKSGAIKIVPETWAKTWFNWLDNIQPWCVSRQLWWGHRIPAWFGPRAFSPDEKLSQHFPDLSYDVADEFALANIASLDEPAFVAETEDDAIEQAKQYYASKLVGREHELVLCDTKLDAFSKMDSAEYNPKRQVLIWRDEDVLDTWFSSALWPFATLGWPEQTDDLKRHYPNDVLISGFDILFFWDARMAMQGIEFMAEVPWKTLYLHGLVRDAAGQKMSKSKGNTVDPLGLIDRYGSDALRFTMAAMESQGRDIKLDEKRVEGYRNFATKLWNAARFLQGNGVGASQSIAAPRAELAVNRWIIGEVVETLARLDKAIADLRYDEMADAIYHFTWGTFCDWYVELVKGAWDDETRAVAAWAFDQILVMLHPFMPFVTEELWHSMGKRPYELIVAKWPAPDASRDTQAAIEIERVIEVISAIRAQRTEIGLAPGLRIPMAVLEDPNDQLQVLQANTRTISQLARVTPVELEYSAVEGMEKYEMELHGMTLTPTFQKITNPSTYWKTSIQIPTETMTLVIGLDGFADLDAEKQRLRKALEASERDRDSLAARLGNASFTERAKPEAVEKTRADHDARAAEVERLAAALARLG